MDSRQTVFERRTLPADAAEFIAWESVEQAEVEAMIRGGSIDNGHLLATRALYRAREV